MFFKSQIEYPSDLVGETSDIDAFFTPSLFPTFKSIFTLEVKYVISNI